MMKAEIVVRHHGVAVGELAARDLTWRAWQVGLTTYIL
jgi:hypothetical protein